jgi:hypothetical protein
MSIYSHKAALLIARLLSAIPACAAAQDAAATPQETTTAAQAAAPVAAAPNGCELHIWPAERMNAVTTGWLAGFGVLGAIADSAAHAKGDSG